MTKNIEIQVVRETEDDCYRHYATAKRDGVTGHGEGYTEASAIVRAKLDLEKREKGFTPTTPNWENTPEAFLCAGDVCPDYSIFAPVWG
jgi:hypothetical protein